MNISTLDPISMHDISDIDSAPYVIEGEGVDAFKIYFENDENKAVYMEIPLQTSNNTHVNSL